MEDQRRERRILALILSGSLLVIILPLIMIILGLNLDSLFDFPEILVNPLNIIVGIPILTIGFFWGIWSNLDLFRKGHGSPVPTKSTETIFLVESGPYRYCRNPMIFGYVLIFVGLGLVFNSISLLGIFSPLILGLLITYVKLREERDLEKRFGESYRNYKNITSFIIPWFPKNQK